MKHISEFRRRDTARELADAIHRHADVRREYRLMEFCGGHTHAIFRFALPELLPGNVRFIHGPGCPVCILPSARVAAMIDLLQREDVTVCTYGDVLRVPGMDGKSLHKARAEGADVRVVYSPLDCLSVAAKQSKPVIFFAVGFETTAPATAALVRQAKLNNLNNLTIYCNHVLTPAALQALLGQGNRQFDGILGPSHVSTITGTGMYEPYVARYAVPIVVAGFEPLDILQSTLMLIQQLNEDRVEVENEYRRAVEPEGNRVAQSLMDEVFCVRNSFEWRGLGSLPNSAYALREEFAQWDTEKQFSMDYSRSSEHKACECPAILRGEKQPRDCKLFGKVCRPDNPLGACMVSSEGACAAEWQYRSAC